MHNYLWIFYCAFTGLLFTNEDSPSSSSDCFHRHCCVSPHSHRPLAVEPRLSLLWKRSFIVSSFYLPRTSNHLAALLGLDFDHFSSLLRTQLPCVHVTVEQGKKQARESLLGKPGVVLVLLSLSSFAFFCFLLHDFISLSASRRKDSSNQDKSRKFSLKYC